MTDEQVQAVWGEMPKDARFDIEPSLLDGLDNYLLHRIETGGFLRSLLENDLEGAIIRAHPKLNLRAFKNIMQALHTWAPALSYGSPAKVKSWLAREDQDIQEGYQILASEALVAPEETELLGGLPEMVTGGLSPPAREDQAPAEPGPVTREAVQAFAAALPAESDPPAPAKDTRFYAKCPKCNSPNTGIAGLMHDYCPDCGASLSYGLNPHLDMPPVDRTQRISSSGRVVTTEGPAPDPELIADGPYKGQHKGYWVLSPEERARGFVRPVRTKYEHRGRKVCGKRNDQILVEHGVSIGAPPGTVTYLCAGPVGHEGECATHAPVNAMLLNRFNSTGFLGGCGFKTVMGPDLAETYARDPSFYTDTFCTACGGAFPVGKQGEFVWAGTDELVGT